MNKYCVKGCKELAEWTREYDRKYPNSACDIRGNNTEGYYSLKEEHENFRWWNHEKTPEGYIVLSFEEFKRIVLDGNSEEQNFNIWD